MFTLVLLSGICTAMAMGFLGVFVIFKRMALVGDALSHVALPGIALAIALGIDPLWGAAVFLGIASVAVFYLARATQLYEEAIVGILFSVALAAGVLFLRGRELDDALFGNVLSLGKLDIALAISISLAIALVTAAMYRAFALTSFSSDLAQANGVNVDKTNFSFLILLAMAVALGVKVVGTLLVGSLVIIPPASAANLAKSLKGLSVLGVLFAACSTALGLVTAHQLHLLPGPMIVIYEGALFLLSLVIKLAL